MNDDLPSSAEVTEFCRGKRAVLLLGQPVHRARRHAVLLRPSIGAHLKKDVLPMAGKYTTIVLTACAIGAIVQMPRWR